MAAARLAKDGKWSLPHNVTMSFSIWFANSYRNYFCKGSWNSGNNIDGAQYALVLAIPIYAPSNFCWTSIFAEVIEVTFFSSPKQSGVFFGHSEFDSFKLLVTGHDRTFSCSQFHEKSSGVSECALHRVLRTSATRFLGFVSGTNWPK